MKWKCAIIFVTVAIGLAPAARADGIDLVPYLTRVTGEGHSPLYVVAMLLLFMATNYVLNFAVIGLPAIRLGSAPGRTVAKGLIALTLMGQIADRIGALLAAVLSVPLMFLLERSGEDAWVVPLLALNFIFSGLAVAALAFYFLRRRWGIRRGVSWIVSIAAGVLTNPMAIAILWGVAAARGE